MMPKRGEIWHVDLGEVRGHEQAGFRPAIVIQNGDLAHLSTSMIIPLSTKPNPHSAATNVPIAMRGTGLPQDSLALCHQLRALDNRRLVRRIGEIGPEKMSEIETALAYLLEISL
jgi:mRNA interferase MazF